MCADDYDDVAAVDCDGGAAGAHYRVGGERVGGAVNTDVTVQVPTANMVLSGPPPGEHATADDVIKHLGRMLAAAEQRNAEMEIALGTVTNIAACALKVLADMGLEDGPGEFSFSHDLTDRMYGANLTLAEDFAGGIKVRFRERTTAPVLLER